MGRILVNGLHVVNTPAQKISNSHFGIFPRRTTRRSSLQMQETNAFPGKWRVGLRPDRRLEAKKRIAVAPGKKIAILILILRLPSFVEAFGEDRIIL